MAWRCAGLSIMDEEGWLKLVDRLLAVTMFPSGYATGGGERGWYVAGD